MRMRLAMAATPKEKALPLQREGFPALPLSYAPPIHCGGGWDSNPRLWVSYHIGGKMQIKSVLGAVLIAGGLAAGMACNGPQSIVEADTVREYAQCIANPEKPLYLLAGAIPDASVHEANLWAELAAGETTLDQMEASFTLFCK